MVSTTKNRKGPKGVSSYKKTTELMPEHMPVCLAISAQPPAIPAGVLVWRIAALDHPPQLAHVSAMAGAVTNELLLEHLKAMRAELATLIRQNRELRDRLTEVHAAVVALRRDQRRMPRSPRLWPVRVDRISDRGEIIEKRLELVD